MVVVVVLTSANARDSSEFFVLQRDDCWRFLILPIERLLTIVMPPHDLISSSLGLLLVSVMCFA